MTPCCNRAAWLDVRSACLRQMVLALFGRPFITARKKKGPSTPEFLLVLFPFYLDA